jgi:hypothetical protein
MATQTRFHRRRLLPAIKKNATVDDFTVNIDESPVENL